MQTKLATASFLKNESVPVLFIHVPEAAAGEDGGFGLSVHGLGFLSEDWV
jgi:hypothetical protein